MIWFIAGLTVGAPIGLLVACILMSGTRNDAE